MAFVLNSFFVHVCRGLVSVACFVVGIHASALLALIPSFWIVFALLPTFTYFCG